MRRLENVSENYLECRDLKHSWTWATDFVDYKDGGKIVSVTRALRCTRCRTVRYDEYSAKTMEKVRGSYSYPDGYHITGGHLPVPEVRRELYLRHKAKRKK